MADWDKLFMVNVRGVMMCCKHFAKHMVEQGGGKIINLSSIRGARAALGGNLAYCSSKGAIDMMTKQLAVELASKNVQVNAIGPIITITPMTEERVRREADRYEKMLVNIPMGRMGQVADLIGPAVFLASRAADFVTGTILYPDGGTMSFV
jgi:gluconate 5-dehydrogenase